mgnify:FL=1
MSVTLDNSNVSKVLGQVVDYPDQYDPSILVREPRQGNRKHLDISDDDPPFVGCDIWNAYEMSCLTKKGQPVTGIAKIQYPATNKYIVESKSIKLYFNSFNMTRLGETQEEAIAELTERAEQDLSDLLETDVRITIFSPDYINNRSNSAPYFNKYHTVETDTEMMDGLEFDKYTETPELLLENKRSAGRIVTQKLHSSLLKSNCRVTNQPDWGDVYIYMESTNLLDYKDFAKYVVSYRDECHFHEEICETFYKRLWDLYRPERLAVTCLYARRGGIDINPVRVSHVDLFNNNLIDMEQPFIKTPRQ